MIHIVNNDKLIVRYLLGEASEAEQQQLEEGWFADDSFFEVMLAAEDDLIDSYVRGELPPQAGARFEQHFLTTPERRQRVEFARTMRKSLTKVAAAPVEVAAFTTRHERTADEERVSWWQSLLGVLSGGNSAFGLAAVATLVVLVLGGIGALVVLQRSEPAQLVAERRTQPSTDATTEAIEEIVPEDQATRAPRPGVSPEVRPTLEGARKPQQQQPRLGRSGDNQSPRLKEPATRTLPQSIVASFVLTPGLVRSIGEVNTLSIPPNAKQLRLQLALERDEYQSYRAVLQTPEGTEASNQSALKAQSTGSGKAVILQLPAASLSKGDYILTLKGVTAEGKVEDLSEFSFSVVKK